MVGRIVTRAVVGQVATFMLVLISLAGSFSPHCRHNRQHRQHQQHSQKHHQKHHHHHHATTAKHARLNMHNDALQNCFLTIAAADEESWRQYVPLAVSGAVIVDILLGSPLANAALLLVRRNDDEETTSANDNKNDNAAAAKDATRQDSATMASRSGEERVDSQKIAADAVAKAQNTLELKTFLDERKSEWDKMEDIKRKMDMQALELEENLSKLPNTITKPKKDA